MSVEAGQQLLHYRLIEKIGEGGMGIVWKALDTSLDRDAAMVGHRHYESLATTIVSLPIEKTDEYGMGVVRKAEDPLNRRP